MTCTRCGGSGIMMAYLFHKGGVCLRCNGSGVDPKGTNLVRPGKIHQETVVAGRKIVLTTKQDPSGRFEAYSVYVEGAVNHGFICQNIRDANTAFKTLKEQALAAR